MSRFTQCYDPAPQSGALPLSAVCRVIVVLTVVLTLGLAHIHLRVTLNRVGREISSLQADQGRLLSEINALRSENESFKDSKTLQAYAINELGMVPYDPGRRQSIAMPREIHTRYALARAASRNAGMQVASADGDGSWLLTLSERFGLINDALAEGSE